MPALPVVPCQRHFHTDSQRAGHLLPGRLPGAAPRAFLAHFVGDYLPARRGAAGCHGATVSFLGYTHLLVDKATTSLTAAIFQAEPGGVHRGRVSGQSDKQGVVLGALAADALFLGSGRVLPDNRGGGLPPAEAAFCGCVIGIRMTDWPKISIVTPSFNQGKFLEKTILSVLEQDYPNLEYIIIDGGSTDSSVEIIKKYEQHLSYWVSEPDRGQSHAINKGFAKTTGEILGWLNSDDWYYPGALRAVAEAFANNPKTGAVVGIGDFYYEEFNRIQTVEPFPVTMQSLYGAVDRFFMQPSCFFTHKVWNECGPLDELLQLAMDLDLWLKIAKKHDFAIITLNLSGSLVHETAKTTALAAQSLVDASLVIMRHGGQKEGRERLISFVQELYDVRRRVGIVEAENQELKEVVQCANERIEMLENSLSWKITAPLRRLGDALSFKAARRLLPEITYANSLRLEEMKALLAKKVKENPTIMLLDFNLGGGSTLYSRNFISHMKSQGHAVVVLEYRYGQKIFNIGLTTGEGTAEVTFSSNLTEVFREVLEGLSIDYIVVSQLVTWPGTSNILKKIMTSKVPYFVLMHDYFLLCPNWTLIDYWGNFCNLPEDPKTCAVCLKSLRHIDVPIEEHTTVKRIEPWRDSAGKFFSEAQKVICFSRSSEGIVKKAYPLLKNIVVNEHCVPDRDAFSWKVRTFDSSKILTIAVVGALRLAKGSLFLNSLLGSPEFRDLPVRIVLVGNTTHPPESALERCAHFIVHGEYNRANLGQILEQYDTSIVFIPSLWPETFCYTVSEVVLLGYPVACFNLGAQAERVKKNDLGWVIPELTLDAVIKIIKDILERPSIVGEKSLNTSSYIPASSEQHFALLENYF